MDQAEFHRTAISKEPNDRIFAIQKAREVFHNFLDKSQAENELLQLAKDANAEVRSSAVWAIGKVFGDLPDKSQAWKDLLRLAKDEDAEVRDEVAEAICVGYYHSPDKFQAEKDLLVLAKDEVPVVRIVAAQTISEVFGVMPNKSQAENELLQLAKDENEWVRVWAAKGIGYLFSDLPEKTQAENDLLQLAGDKNAEVRESAIGAIGAAFDDLRDKFQAENILRQLSTDENAEVRAGAARAIGWVFGKLQDKSQAENYLLQLAKDKDAEVRNSAARSIEVTFRDLPDKFQAENILLQLAEDENAGVRTEAARAIGRAFSELRDKSQAEKYLLQLAKDEDAEVRTEAARAIGGAFSRLRDKFHAEKYLLRLAEDEDEKTRNVAQSVIKSLNASFTSNGSPFAEVLAQNEQPNNSEKFLKQQLGKIPPLDIPPYAIPDSTGGEDLLGSAVYAQALADFIRNEKTEKPITIGVDAAWGMGKTFLMEMICKELVGEERFRRSRGLIGVRSDIQGNKSGLKENQLSTVNEDDGQRRLMAVWFNAWKYDKEGSLWAALTLEILRQLRQQSGFRDWAELIIKVNLARFEWERLFEKFVRITIFAIPVLLLSLVVSLFNLFVTKYDMVWLLSQSFQDYGLVWLLALMAAMVVTFKYLYTSLMGPFDLKISQYLREPDYRERIGFLAQFEEDFSRVINIITKEGQKTLVIFIDDLDRCSPPKPVEIVEAINTLIDAKDCVFVIGMDGKAVASSIEAKYKDLRDYLDKTGDSAGASLGQRFLDKIIQINFRIPTAESNSISNLIKHMMPTINLSEGTLRQNKELDRNEREVTEIDGGNKNFQVERDAFGSPEYENEIEDVKVGHRKEKSSEYNGEIGLPESDHEKKKEDQKILEFAQNFDDFDEVIEAIKSAQPYLKANPRRIKKFLNYFRLLALIANRKRLLESKIINLDLLAKWTVIQIRWPDIIDTLETDGCFVERLNKAQELQNRIQGSSEERKNSVQDTTPEINKLRYRARNAKNTSKATEMIASDRRCLNQLLADPKISRMAEEREFMTLIGEFKETLFNYVHLAQVV